MSATSRAPTAPLGNIRLLEFWLVILMELFGDPSIGVKRMFWESIGRLTFWDFINGFLWFDWDWDCRLLFTHCETEPLILRGFEKLVTLPRLEPEPPNRKRGLLLVVATDTERLVFALAETRPTEHRARGDSLESGRDDAILWFLWKESGRDNGE